MTHAEDARIAPEATPADGRRTRPPGLTFVLGVTVFVVAFAALIAFLMYWVFPAVSF